MSKMLIDPALEGDSVQTDKNAGVPGVGERNQGGPQQAEFYGWECGSLGRSFIDEGIRSCIRNIFFFYLQK